MPHMSDGHSVQKVPAIYSVIATFLATTAGLADSARRGHIPLSHVGSE